MRRIIESLHADEALSDESIVLTLLDSRHPELRAAACVRIGARRLVDFGHRLISRMSDQDWRVRAAASEATSALFEGSGVETPRDAPLRDMPVNQRERIIFWWIAAWNAPASALPTLPDLCELYAPNAHWLTGETLASACFDCHIPTRSLGVNDVAACIDCHGYEHETWLASAHAQTATHMNLLRVNPQTRQVEAYNHGDSRGLVCTDCHQFDTSSQKEMPAGTQSLAIPHRFFSAENSCQRCHADIQSEFEAWQKSPRFVAVNFPPGEVVRDEEPGQRTCVSCHMEPKSSGSTQLDHRMTARRDLSLLRAGLRAHIEQMTPGGKVQLVLTNLAGHAYPAGTIRRGLRIDMKIDGDATTRRHVLRLTDAKGSGAIPVQSPLQPGEERRIDLPGAGDASSVSCDVIFERNHFVPGSLEVVVQTIDARLMHRSPFHP